MTEAIWRPLINTFDSNTRGTQKNALSLFADHDAKLDNEKADADILVCYNLFNPAFASYQNIYVQKQMVDGTHKGKTLGFTEVLADLPNQLRIWEAQTRIVFVEDSPTDREIWPNKRSPFLQGTYEQRIAALETLAAKLLQYPALAATQLLVQSAFNSAEAVRLAQQNAEGASAQLSILLEEQRLIVCNEMYGVLGLLMQKYKADPPQIARFYDLSLLRETGDDGVREGTVNGGQVKNLGVSNLTINAGTSILLRVLTGGDTMRFYFAATTSAQPGAAYMDVQGGTEQTVTAAALGLSGTNVFLLVKNIGAPAAEYHVEIG